MNGLHLFLIESLSRVQKHPSYKFLRVNFGIHQVSIHETHPFSPVISRGNKNLGPWKQQMPAGPGTNEEKSQVEIVETCKKIIS